MKHITETISDNIPAWMQKGIDDRNLFTVCIKKVEDLEKELQAYKRIFPNFYADELKEILK